MGNIVLLDELTINKIAAGEVIERPASVIKEMVENSIDANATSITIEIKNGGISYIKIVDNGKGIEKDDLEMAFERHATSKIRNAEDLNTVTSMGFRGEALASVAAISNVELVSKTINQDIGYKVVVEGGKFLQKEEVGCSTGTTITVKNLFYNTPVRYKFLKKDYTETGYIEDIVTRIALIHPEIAIKLIDTGKTIIHTYGNGDLKSVIYNIYGKDIALDTINVDYTYEDIKVKGVIGRPQVARSNKSNQLFFVNKRYVKDKILTVATSQAYKELIEQGKFAFVVLNLEMSPNKVDVNVHPAKLEVRFEEENKVFQAVFHAIKDALAKDSASKDEIIKVDNIIIQTSNEETNTNVDLRDEKNTYGNLKDEKSKSIGLFGWKKMKRDKKYDNNDNIIEEVYNKKKMNEYSDLYNKENDKKDDLEKFNNIDDEKSNIFEKASINRDEKTNIFEKASINKDEKANIFERASINKDEKNIKIDAGLEDSIVNTSDVLNELKQINKQFSNDTIEEKQTNGTNNENETIFKIEENNLPDGSTYTYIGENKNKIEDLLRQLHPDTYKPKEIDKVAEENTSYDVEEHSNIENIENESTNQEEKDINIQKTENSLDTEHNQLYETNGANTSSEANQENDVNSANTSCGANQENDVNGANTSSEAKQENDVNGANTSSEVNQENDVNANISSETNQENDVNGANTSSEAKQENDVNGANTSSEANQENEANGANTSNKTNEIGSKQNLENDQDENSAEFNQMYRKMFGTAITKYKEEKNDNKINAVDILNNNVSMFEGMHKYQKPSYKYIGIVFDSYILAEIEKEMYIINMKTAKEKVIYEKIKNNYYKQIEKDSQMLLLPDIIGLSYKQMQVVKENYDILESAGFRLEEFGDNTIKLTGVPTVCLELNTKQLFIDILDEINTVARTSKREKEEKFMTTIASQIAQKFNYINDIQEINSLIDELLQFSDPFAYDFNKPIAIKMTKYDIERKFSRK